MAIRTSFALASALADTDSAVDTCLAGNDGDFGALIDGNAHCCTMVPHCTCTRART